MTTTATALELVDLERYPIDAPAGDAYAACVAAAQAQLAALGAAELAGFVHPGGVAALTSDAESLAQRAFHSGGLGTAYLELPDDHWAKDHPRQTWRPYAVGAVGYDVIPTSSPLRVLYESDELLAFLRAVLDRGEIFRYADGCGALNLAVMAAGDELQWHFDQTDFVVSLAIQAAEHGGDFDVVPRILAADDEHYDDVARVFAGAHDGVVTLPMTPGTLLIFEGRHSLHRVSPIEGDRLRHVGLLAYDTKPGTCSSDLLREVRYGRSVPRHPARDVAAFVTELGEAFVGSGDEAAHVNTVLGAKGGPVETAWATALATPRKGHVAFVVAAQPGIAVKPMTLFVNKATIATSAHAAATWGPAQAGVASGVLDALADSTLNASLADDLVCIVAAWIAATATDHDAIYRFNREATHAALRAGALRQPTVGDALAVRDEPFNGYWLPPSMR